LIPHLLAAAPSIKVPHIEYSVILPELILLGGAAGLLVVHSLTRRYLPRGSYSAFTVLVSAAALGASVWLWQDIDGRGARTAIAGAIAVDGFSALFLILISSALMLAALTGESFLRREGIDGPEYYVLAMLSASGAMFMAAANDLIMIFLGLEILSIALYVLAGYNSSRRESREAAVKYFLLGAFSSAIFVYGIALTYGATGTTNLPQIASFLARNVIVSNGVLLAGLALLLVGFCFKIAAVPFHTWTPDVYQGAPTPVTSFMAAVAKAGGFAGLLRVFFSSFHVLRLDWEPLVWAIAVVTLLGGAVLAVVQQDIKRMLAYSSINHAGFVLVGLQAATVAGISGSLYYLFVYAFMVMGSFAVVTVVGARGDARHSLEDYRGLARRQPVLAVALTVLLLAQAGIPFTTGFFAKFYVVAAAVGSRSYALAVIAMVSAVIAAFFYLRVVFLMYSRAGEEGYGLAPEASADSAPAPAFATAGAPVGPGPVSRASVTAAGGGGTGGTGGAPSAASGASATGSGGGGGGAPGARRLGWLTSWSPGVPVGIAATLVMSLGVTIVFGIWPSPIFDFAHHATLLF
jgi:NADH-quinone oxidoreductase subunit N